MKKILFSLLLVFCCTITCAQKKSEVLDALRKTVEEYFMPDFNEAIENPEWRADGLASCSRVYIEPNHFFRNGKVCKSYADWVDQYCSQSLQGKIIGHTIALDENLQKVSGNNDLYSVEATLSRSWATEEGPAIPNEKLKITFLWRGAGKLVHIMHLDGDMSPVKMPEPVKPPVTDNKPASSSETVQYVAEGNGRLDYVSDSSAIGYFFVELVEEIKKEKKTVIWSFIIFSCVMFVLIIGSNGFKFQDISDCTTNILASLLAGLIFIFFLFGLVNGGILAYNIYKGKHVGSQVRSVVLDAYERHRLAVPGKAVAVCRKDKWGLVDYNGKVIQPLELDSISPFYKDVAVAFSQGKAAFLPLAGTDEFQWVEKISPISEGKALICMKEENNDESQYYLFDYGQQADKIYTPLPYDEIYFPDSPDLNRYKVRKNKKYGLIDGRGEVIVQPVYDGMSISYTDERICVYERTVNDTKRINGTSRKIGYLDMDGRLVIPLKYEYALGFSEGLAKVRNEAGMVGYINTQGELEIPFIFSDGESFLDGFAVVAVKDNQRSSYGAIDKKGDWILLPKFAYSDEVIDAFYSHLSEEEKKLKRFRIALRRVAECMFCEDDK